VASGLALSIAFPPSNIAALSWVAFVPLLFAMRREPARRVFVYAWIQGFVFSAATFFWIVGSLRASTHTALFESIVQLLLLAVIDGLLAGAAFALGKFIHWRAHVFLAISVPVAWVAVEWLRTFLPVGLWTPVGSAFYRNLTLIQFSDGVYGLSALVLLVNVAIYKLIAGWESMLARVSTAVVAGGLVVGATIFGTVRMNQIERAPGTGSLKIAILRGDPLQGIHRNPPDPRSAFGAYADQTRAAARLHPDLTIWPETDLPFDFEPGAADADSPESQTNYEARVLALARATHGPILLVASPIDSGSDGVATRKCAYLVSADGQVAGYHKQAVLAPFGRYASMRAMLRRFADESIGYVMRSSRRAIFDVKGAGLAVLIGYESRFPNLARRAVNAGANVLINVASDSWFANSSASRHFLAMEAMRAVENHTPIVRASSAGITAVITPTGRIVPATALAGHDTEIETVRWKRADTFYTRFGDLFAESCFGRAGVRVTAWFGSCSEAEAARLRCPNGNETASVELGIQNPGFSPESIDAIAGWLKS
jgi:apolipoprotein N-acyltransferase